MTGELVMIDPFWVPLAMLLLGLAAAFFGRRLIGPVLSIAGLALGLLYGAGIAGAISDNPGFIRLGPWLFGVLFAVLSGLFLRLAVFLAGALLALSAAFCFISPPSLTIALVAMVLGGGLACAYRTFVFALFTAAFGALCASAGAVNLAANFSIPIGIAGYYLILAVVFAAGLLVQLRTGRRDKAGPKRKRR